MEIRSATSHTKFAGAHIRQIYWILGGVAGMFLVSLINYQKLLDRVHWLYIAAIVSLMSVMLFGQKYLGARRWVKMPGGAHFQPSEWVKLILILAVAKYFADLHQRELSWPDFMKAGAIVLVPMLMVLRQPDLGTASPTSRSPSSACFWAGSGSSRPLIVIRWRWPCHAAGVACLKPYQRDRLTSFMHPEADSQGSGYQVNQSLIAVGSGGIWGRSGRFADPLGVSPCPTNRLYLRRVCRGTWFCRSLGGNAVILYSADAIDPERANGARPRWHVRGHGCGGGA